MATATNAAEPELDDVTLHDMQNSGALINFMNNPGLHVDVRMNQQKPLQAGAHHEKGGEVITSGFSPDAYRSFVRPVHLSL